MARSRKSSVATGIPSLVFSSELAFFLRQDPACGTKDGAKTLVFTKVQELRGREALFPHTCVNPF